MVKKEKRVIIWWFLIPMLVMYSIFFIYPLLLNILYSFLNWNGFTKSANWIGFENYRELLFDGLFWNAVKNSSLFALLGTISQVVVSFFLAYLVEFHFHRRKKWYRTIFILPIVATTATIGMLMKSLFSYEGLVNYVVTILGGDPVPWLSDPRWAFFTVIFVSTWKETGTLFIYWIAGFQMISPAVLEAAEIDGATGRTLLTRIILPMIQPVVVVVSTVTFLNALKVFDLIQTLTAGGPYFSTDMVGTFIYRTAFSSSFGSPRLSYASSVAVLCVFFLVFCSLIVKVIKKIIARKDVFE